MFREGRTKGLGVVKEINFDRSKPLNPGGLKTNDKDTADAPGEKMTKEQKAEMHGGGAKKDEKMKYQTATAASSSVRK